MRKIAVSLTTGGVGKTTAVNLAADDTALDERIKHDDGTQGNT